MADYQQLFLDMPPSLSGDDGRDIRLPYAISLRQFHLGQIARADGVNVRFGQFGTVMPLALDSMRATFRGFIRHVGSVIAKPKMRRIAARRVVASMQNKPAPVPLGMRQEIGNPVGIIFVSLIVASAVVFGTKACPFPAVVWRALLDPCPKGFWRVRSHRSVIA